MKNAYILLLSSFFIILCPHKASSTVPFLTSQPEPVETGHVAFYLYSTVDKIGSPLDATIVKAPTINGKWGVLPDCELAFIAPLVTRLPNPSRPQHKQHTGLGDIITDFKYRFLNNTSLSLQGAFIPTIALPTGNNNHLLGNGKFWGQLPLWFQKKWGSWSLDAGGGYAINSASGELNYFFGGGKLRYEFTNRLTLGVELFLNQRKTMKTKDMATVNAGGYYYVTKCFKVLFSAGHTVSGTQHFIALFGLGWEN